MVQRNEKAGLTPLDLAVALVTNLVWGVNIIAVKMSLAASQPFTVGAMRLGVVAIMCLPALRIVPGRMRWLLVLGLVQGTLFLALTNLGLATANNISALAIAGQLNVPFTLLLAVLLLKERIHWPRIAGVALAFLGVAAMLFDPAIVRDLPALVFVVGASLAWACGSLMQRHLAGVPVLTLYAWLGVIGFATLLPLAWWLEPTAIAAVPDMRLRDFAWIVFSALASTLIGQGGMAWLLGRHPVGTIAPLTLASPVVGVAASAWFFAHPLTPPMIAGGVVALAGVAVITLRSARQSR